MAAEVIADRRESINPKGSRDPKAIATYGDRLLTVSVIFLPIAERELRVSARKRSTFWVRVTAATAALLIGGGFLLLMMLGPGLSATTLGRNLFAVLTWLALAAALSAGLFFTSDALSEEKREGTLGFLFLTDLRGSDVVIGKLLAAGLRGLYGFLAVLPILGVTLLMGGVTGAAFFKTSLALLNALLASLVAGLFVSAISRDSQKALVATVVLLGCWIAAGPIIDAGLARIKQVPFRPLLSVVSPGYLFIAAGSSQPVFWWAVLVNQVLIWGLVAASSRLLPRTWQDKPSSRSVRIRRNVRRRASLRRELVNENPIVWLASLDRWPASVLWIIAVAGTAGSAAMFAITQKMVWLFWSYLGSAVSIIIYLLVAAQAARFFVEARRTGLLELLLATPLTAQQIVHGQWRALLRMFALPLVLFLAAQAVTMFMGQRQTFQLTVTATRGPPVPATNAPGVTNVTVLTTSAGVGGGASGTGQNLMSATLALAGTAGVAFALAASMWFGMWMGLTSKNTVLATLKTMFWVHILPWFAVGFVSGIVVSLFFFTSGIIKRMPGAPLGNMVWFTYVSSALGMLLYLGINIFFWRWARRKLHSEFRVRAAATIGQEIMTNVQGPMTKEAPKH